MPVSSRPIVALAHPASDGGVHHATFSSWTFEPGVVLPLCAAAVFYAFGVHRLWQAAGRGHGLSRAQAASFSAGIAALVIAFVSPIDAISTELFSVHMIQHELLMIVAAPLLVLGSPIVAFVWTLPKHTASRLAASCRTDALSHIWAFLTAPAVVWLLHAAALWMWHVPVLYAAALRSDVVHALEHACFFITASLFWWGLTRGRYGRLGYGAAVIYVFATALHSGLLGAALTISPRVWYPIHAATTAAWGLSALEDQQLAGLIMWIPAGVLFTVVGLFFFAAWLQESARRARFPAVLSCMLLLCIAASQPACRRDVGREAYGLTGGDPERGRAAINQYGCDTCHTIPGVRTAQGRVGPPLTGVAARVYLAGHIPNTPGNMQDWIRFPHKHDAQTVMPETGVTEQDARDIAAYLYTLQ